MKFDKFGIFPKTPNPKSTSNSLFDLKTLLNLIPSLLTKNSEQPTNESQKQTNLSKQKSNQYTPDNTKAYSAFLQKHDQFVKKINRDKE